jgi:hypothetical protein
MTTVVFSTAASGGFFRGEHRVCAILSLCDSFKIAQKIHRPECGDGMRRLSQKRECRQPATC